MQELELWLELDAVTFHVARGTIELLKIVEFGEYFLDNSSYINAHFFTDEPVSIKKLEKIH